MQYEVRYKANWWSTRIFDCCYWSVWTYPFANGAQPSDSTFSVRRRWRAPPSALLVVEVSPQTLFCHGFEVKPSHSFVSSLGASPFASMMYKLSLLGTLWWGMRLKLPLVGLHLSDLSARWIAINLVPRFISLWRSKAVSPSHSCLLVLLASSNVKMSIMKLFKPQCPPSRT